MSSQIQRHSPAYRMVLEMILIIIFHFMNSKPVRHSGIALAHSQARLPDARKRHRIQSKRHHQYTHTPQQRKNVVCPRHETSFNRRRRSRASSWTIAQIDLLCRTELAGAGEENLEPSSGIGTEREREREREASFRST